MSVFINGPVLRRLTTISLSNRVLSISSVEVGRKIDSRNEKHSLLDRIKGFNCHFFNFSLIIKCKNVVTKQTTSMNSY